MPPPRDPGPRRARHRRGLLLASVLVALPNPLYAWATDTGTPPPVAVTVGQLLLLVALGLHTWALVPVCRGVLRALGAALLTLALAWVATYAVASLAFDLWTLYSAGGEIAGLVAGLVAGLLTPFPAHLVAGRGVRAVLASRAGDRARAGGGPRRPEPWPGRR